MAVTLEIPKSHVRPFILMSPISRSHPTTTSTTPPKCACSTRMR